MQLHSPSLPIPETFCTVVSLFEGVLVWFLFGAPKGRGFRDRGTGRKKFKDMFVHSQSCLGLEGATLSSEDPVNGESKA